ncbi:OmpP1/FadL family transporter [Vibrio rumoiensis]|uniref:Long-chain fatty acid transporter n=1 Tax=Vibrio rumoiensis 1S-45 TaxID=1188252 RepID=A0A1E5E4T5_9VIBR|nr:outer membrane protein transport protein [Vibrio rumoiensis]OEF28127.1 hypothetical protein A1QC_05655 [Vibrio rumoiensis 1S-45]
MRLSPLVYGGLILTSFQSIAGGIYLNEIGTDDVGLSAAGVAARAQDPSVMYMNPAGLSRLDGRHATVAGEAIYGNANYDLDAPGAGDTGNAIGFVPSASAFYSQQINDQWTVGLGFYGMFGLGLDFGNWAGSNAIQSVDMKGLTLQPTASYRLNDQWSFGAGLGINYGILKVERAGESVDDSDVALNYHLGVLYELDKNTRFGVGYTSETNYDYDIKTNVTVPVQQGPITVNVDAALPLSGTANAPQQLIASAFHQLNATWAIMGNLGWQDWSKYGDADLTVASQIGVPSKDRLQDTYSFAFGVQHQYSDKLTLNSGIGYDTSVYKSQGDTSLTMPSGGALMLGVGMKYKLEGGQSFGVAVQYMDLESSSVEDGSLGLGGTYHDPSIWFLAFNYNWDNF